MFLIVALAGSGGTLCYFKFRKPKTDASGNADLSEYDFDEDEPENEEMEDDTTEKYGCKKPCLYLDAQTRPIILQIFW